MADEYDDGDGSIDLDKFEDKNAKKFANFDDEEAENDGTKDSVRQFVKQTDSTKTVAYTTDGGERRSAPVDYEPHFENWRATNREGRLWSPWKELGEDSKRAWVDSKRHISQPVESAAIEADKALRSGTSTAADVRKATGDVAPIGKSRFTLTQRQYNARQSAKNKMFNTMSQGAGSHWSEGWAKTEGFGERFQVPATKGERLGAKKSVQLQPDKSHFESLEHLGSDTFESAPDEVKSNADFLGAYRDMHTNLYKAAVANNTGKKQDAALHYGNAVAGVMRMGQVVGGMSHPAIRQAHGMHLGYLSAIGA